MKKAIAILLSLILVFCFVSCDNSAKTPDGSSDGSSNKPSTSIPTVQEDPNVPPSSEFKDAVTDDFTNIINLLSAVRDAKGTYSSENRYTESFKIKDGVTIGCDNKPISGNYSIKTYSVGDNEKDTWTETFNGKIKIDSDEYELSNVVKYEMYSYTDEKYEKSLTGVVKKGDKEIDISEIETSDPALYEFLYNFNEETNCILESMKDYLYAAYFNINGIGELSIVGSMIDSNNMEGDVVFNFSNVKLSDGKNHSMTGKIKASSYNETKPDSLSVEYLSFDGKYFKPADIEGNNKLMEFFMNMLG